MNSKLLKQLITAAWCSVLLGLGMELLLLIISIAMGGGEKPPAFLADCVQKLSWSVLVCVGVALGLGAAKLRVPIMGLLGLISGPGAFQAAKAAHKSAIEALNTAPIAKHHLPTALQVGSLRAIEYLILGLLIGYISRRPWGSLKAHVAAGASVGLVFGSVFVFLMFRSDPAPSTYAVVSKGVNEMVFPIGCSLVLFAAQTLSKRHGAAPDPAIAAG